MVSPRTSCGVLYHGPACCMFTGVLSLTPNPTPGGVDTGRASKTVQLGAIRQPSTVTGFGGNFSTFQQFHGLAGIYVGL